MTTNYHFVLEIVSDDADIEGKIKTILADRDQQQEFEAYHPRKNGRSLYNLISVADFRKALAGYSATNDHDTDRYAASLMWLSDILPGTEFDWTVSWSYVDADEEDEGENTYSYYHGKESEYDSEAYVEFLINKLGGDDSGASLYKEFLLSNYSQSTDKDGY